MIKRKIQQIMRETCAEHGQDFDRHTKWKMFCSVCDNMLEQGHITKIQHARYTNPF